MWTVTFHYDVTFCVFLLLVSHGAALLVYPLFSSTLIFGNFQFFGVTVKFLLLIGRSNMIVFLLGSLVGVPLGMPLQWTPSEFLHVLMVLLGMHF